MLVDRHGDAFVAFEHVQKSYDGQTLVVKDLNLSIGRGDFSDDAGAVRFRQDDLPDDAGGLRDRANGEIRLGGRPINQVPPHKRGIGMVFQNYACSRT